MLIHPLLDKLQQLRFHGMLEALKEQMHSSGIDSLCFEDRLSLLIDREMNERENRKVATRIKQARLRQDASYEDIDFQSPRGLDRMLILQLADCQWIREHLNVIIIGPTGIGKTYLASAMAHKACRQGYAAQYYRLPRLLQDLAIAKADGRYDKLLGAIARQDLIVLDDWGLFPYNRENQRDILEILEERYSRKSTLVTSQLPLSEWHSNQEDPTLADAILDRLVHNAYKMELTGDSLRMKRTALRRS